jgi:hypothetical protein
MRLSAILLLAAFGVYAFGDAFLAPAPSAEHPGFVDSVLASRVVIAAIRLAIVFGAVYVVVSVVALIARRQWLTKIGPVEVSTPVAGVEADNQQLEGELTQADEDIGKLRQELSVLEDVAHDKGRSA